ncbi:MAG: hypothetical protein O3A95_09560 [Planctomycetota bacterium]|nr:hypothetical protein [Planctomycetota bacterium]MDA1114527.1 hypothetical protein [Planctomycetota bacterium]
MERLPRLLTKWILASLGLVLMPACALAVPGDAAWSDLHVNGFAAIYPVNLDATVNDIVVNDGSGITFDGDLNLDSNRESSFLYGARAGFAPFEVIVSEFGYDGRSSGLTAGGATFLGVVLPTNETLAANVDLDMSITKLMLGIDVINTPIARVGLLIGVDFFEFDRFAASAAETKTILGIDVIEQGDSVVFFANESAPVPIFGARGDVQLPFGVRLGAEVTGISADVDDAEISLLDVEINANYEPWENVEVVIGYRLIDLDVDGSIFGTELKGDIQLDGPFFGVSLYF